MRRSPRFDVQNWSLKEAAPQRSWPQEARRKLNRSDVMLIVATAQTHRARGVLEEVRIARELGVPIRQTYPKAAGRPARLPAAGAPIAMWTHQHLERLLDVPRRRAD